jgi:hypothetical protein
MPNLEEAQSLILLFFFCALQDSPDADPILTGSEGSKCATADLQISSWFQSNLVSVFQIISG